MQIITKKNQKCKIYFQDSNKNSKKYSLIILPGGAVAFKTASPNKRELFY